MKKTKLFLHIGHGKTGTSAVQSALAISSDKLLENGTNYPINTNLKQRASRFEITSGNWENNPDVSLTERCLQLVASNIDNCNIILSSESLFWHLPEMLEEQDQWNHLIDLHVILAVRELEEMLSSEYQQRVKRHGESKPFEQFLKRRRFISSHHKKAAELLSKLALHNISFTLINYSNHKRTISQKIFNAIGCGHLFPHEKMQDLVINRSLSQKELQMLLMINALYYDQYPWICTRLSDALAKKLPNVEARRCRISPKSLDKLYEANDSFIKIINSHLDKSELLTTLQSLDQNRQANRDPETLQKIKKEEKLSVDLISETLLEALRNDPIKQLSNETVDALIKASQSKGTSPEVEVELLEIAKISRPQGPRLTQLLEQAQLKQQQNQEP